MEDLKNIIESLLFVAEGPLSVDQLRKILHPLPAEDIRNTLQQLAGEYENRQGGFLLKEVAGGYQFRTRSEYTEWVKALLQPKPPRLSKAALETLAVIAYKQPVIRSDVEHIRGVDCGGVLRVLLERNLVRVLGRKEIPGRPLIYGTTRRFLEVFDLKDLKDLPTPKEIEEMGTAADGHGESSLPGDEGPGDDAEDSWDEVLPEYAEDETGDGWPAADADSAGEQAPPGADEDDSTR